MQDANICATPFAGVAAHSAQAPLRGRHDASRFHLEIGPSLPSSEAALDQAVNDLERRFPELSARQVLTRSQLVALAIAAAAMLVSAVFYPDITFRGVLLLLSLAVAVNGLFRVLLALVAPRQTFDATVPAISTLLPTYTILVPLYREAPMLPELVNALLALDYPSIMQQAHLKPS